MRDAEALDLFGEEYREYSLKYVPVDDARDWRNVTKILSEYMTRRPMDNAPWDKVMYVEQGFAAPVATVGDTEVWYYSRPDMVVQRDGRLHTVDTKSTGWLKPDWNNQWDVSTQVTGQGWAVEQVLGGTCRDAFIDGIELKAMNSSSKKCAKHGVPYHECAPEHLNFKFHLTHREGFQVSDWVVETGHLVGKMLEVHRAVAQHGLKAADVEGLYTGGCTAYGRFCDYYGYCSTNRQPQMLEQLYVLSEFQLKDAGSVLGPGLVEVEVPVR